MSLVNLSIILLDMNFATKYDSKQVININTYFLFLDCPINFFDSQINAIVFMLQKTFEVILLHKSKNINTLIYKR